MGSDNLFHKNKSKNTQDLRRRKVRREAYKKILIVCEGEKTEPNYFCEAREHYSLNTVNVQVTGNCGSDPMSIYNFAKQSYQREKDAGDPFDVIYCVFDKDAHTNYSNALKAISSTTPKNTFFAINSVPCFEFWLLLHFEFSARPYSTLPTNSSGNQVLSKLKDYLPDYEKGRQDIFKSLLKQLPQAKEYAKKILEICENENTDNPSTRVHQLIEALENLKKN